MSNVLSRIEKLLKKNAEGWPLSSIDAIVSAKTALLSEQLANKELHLNVLRNKLVDLEEEKFGRSELKKRADDEAVESKKLSVKMGKLAEQLRSANAENMRLKSQLYDADTLKTKSEEKNKEIGTLKRQLGENVVLIEKQTAAIGHLHDNLDASRIEIEKLKSASDKSIQDISIELRKNKQELENTKIREKQVIS